MPISQALQWGEIIILALPLEGILSYETSRFLYLAKGKIVMDILSSKASSFSRLEKTSEEIGFRFVSTHPLFGPYLNPVGEKIVLIRSSTSGDMEEISEFWRGVGLTVLTTDVETHEKLMAVIQVLPHFFMLGLSSSLDALSKELAVDYTQFQTTNFKEIFKIINRVRDLDRVVKEIQSSNPYARLARKVGLGELNTLYSTLEKEKK
ncbi:MAG: prephenate dehydrogenase/arogenate dehydrogenase family protein, partial [Metallosphaera sp.]